MFFLKGYHARQLHKVNRKISRFEAKLKEARRVGDYNKKLRLKETLNYLYEEREELEEIINKL